MRSPIVIGKVLVVGGGGYIGSIVTKKLAEKSFSVRVFDKFIYGNRSAVSDSESVEVYRGDVRDAAALHHAMKGCDTVVYLAELVGDPACSACPDLAFELNYAMPCAAALMAKDMGVERFIYTSSCSTYGISEGGVLTEESDVHPVSEYGRRKVLVEKFIQEIADEHFRPVIFRLATVYGLSPRPRFDLMVNTITATAAVNKKITIMGGLEWRPHIHVEDVAAAIVLAIEAPLEVVGGEVFNLGSGENYQIIDIGKMVHAEVPNASFEVIEKPNEDRRSYNVDMSKFKRVAGFRSRWDIQRGIRQMIEYLNENPEWRSIEKSNVLSVKAAVCHI